MVFLGVVYTVLAHCVNYRYLREGEGTLFVRPFVGTRPPAGTVVVWLLFAAWAVAQLVWTGVCTVKHVRVARKLRLFGVDQTALQSAKWDEVVHQLSRTANFCYDELARRTVPHSTRASVSKRVASSGAASSFVACSSSGPSARHAHSARPYAPVSAPVYVSAVRRRAARTGDGTPACA